jgi:hypothetical protein
MTTKGFWSLKLRPFVILIITTVLAVAIVGDTIGTNVYLGTNLGESSASFVGEEAHHGVGLQVSIDGDVNGDGYDDILIGSAKDIYLIFGKETGWTKDTNLSYADASFNKGDGVPTSAYAGDVNGDGFDDIIISGYDGASIVYLFFGKPSGWTLSTDVTKADASFIEENVDDLAGWAVCSAGDVNGDGYDDILIGALGWGSFTGKTYLILGKASGWSKDTDLSQADASFFGDRFDVSMPLYYARLYVASAGDVNGDGYDDFSIGTWNNSCLIFGKASGWTKNVHLSNADDCLNLRGGSAVGVGDVNGDGLDDFLLNRYMFFGRVSGWTKDVDISDADATLSVGFGSAAIAGDVNGDGFDDILFGNSYEDGIGTDSGCTYLILSNASRWSGEINKSKCDASFMGEVENDRSGRYIAGSGDVNGDGLDDILISAPNSMSGAGRVYLILTPFDFSAPPQEDNPPEDNPTIISSTFLWLTFVIIAVVVLLSILYSRRRRNVVALKTTVTVEDQKEPRTSPTATPLPSAPLLKVGEQVLVSTPDGKSDVGMVTEVETGAIMVRLRNGSTQQFDEQDCTKLS